jgi:hypothetical protein
MRMKTSGEMWMLTFESAVSFRAVQVQNKAKGRGAIPGRHANLTQATQGWEHSEARILSLLPGTDVF